MKEKPSQWEFIATVLVLLACATWALYEYRQAPDKIPFEPVIAAATYLIALLGYSKLGKSREEHKTPGVEDNPKPGAETTISHAKNTLVRSKIKATTVHFGDVIHYEGQPIPRALSAQPFQPEVFLGREADLQSIHDKLFSGDHLLLLVNGEGGIGKTTLASKYYLDHQQEYAHTAWLLSEKSIANALLQLAEPLGLQFDERMDAAGRLEILLAKMANLQSPCLLVLDNANELPDLEANYQTLRRLSNFHVLLTTRITNFEKAETCPVEGLPEDPALALFEGYFRALTPDERALFFQIREAVGENTLVLELLAKNLALFNKYKTHYTLSDLLADLQQKGLLALSQTQAVRTDYNPGQKGLRHEKPEDIIAAMYELGELPPEEVALLSVFAVLPAERIAFNSLERLLPKMETLETALLALAQKGWLNEQSGAGQSGRDLKSRPDLHGSTESGADLESGPDLNQAGQAYFKCSPVVQEVSKRKSPDLTAACRPLIEALNKELETEVLHIDNYKHSGLFAHYAETVIGALNEPDYDLGALCQNTGNFHIATGDLSKAIWAYQKMVDVFSALSQENPDDADFKNGLAISYEKLGETQSALGNLEQALTFFEERSRLGKELYEAYPQNVAFKNGLAISYSKLGETQSDLGNLEQALTFFEDETKLFEELYEAYPQNVAFKNGLAISYYKLGQLYEKQGDLPKAFEYFEQDLKFTELTFQSSPTNAQYRKNLKISYDKMGEISEKLGKKALAKGFYKKAKALE